MLNSFIQVEYCNQSWGWAVNFSKQWDKRGVWFDLPLQILEVKRWFDIKDRCWFDHLIKQWPMIDSISIFRCCTISGSYHRRRWLHTHVDVVTHGKWFIWDAAKESNLCRLVVSFYPWKILAYLWDPTCITIYIDTKNKHYPIFQSNESHQFVISYKYLKIHMKKNAREYKIIKLIHVTIWIIIVRKYVIRNSVMTGHIWYRM